VITPHDEKIFRPQSKNLCRTALSSRIAAISRPDGIWGGTGIVGKQIGWHSFRHSLATNLRALGVDIKVAQELLRHASSRTTLDIYTRALSQQKRDVNAKVVEMMLPLKMKKQHSSAPSTELEGVG
jgi:integrase